MTLNNSLYTIVAHSESDSTHRWTLQLNADHWIYKAHFPNQPITPGVCIVQMAKELLEQTVNKELEVTDIKNLKFLNIISPKAVGQLTVELGKIHANDSQVTAQAAVTDGTAAYTKLSFTCRIISGQ